MLDGLFKYQAREELNDSFVTSICPSFVVASRLQLDLVARAAVPRKDYLVDAVTQKPIAGLIRGGLHAQSRFYLRRRGLLLSSYSTPCQSNKVVLDKSGPR